MPVNLRIGAPCGGRWLALALILGGSTASCKENNEVVCPTIYAPVCGIDGKTYSNSCHAKELHKIDIRHEGVCAASSPLTATASNKKPPKP